MVGNFKDNQISHRNKPLKSYLTIYKMNKSINIEIFYHQSVGKIFFYVFNNLKMYVYLLIRKKYKSIYFST